MKIITHTALSSTLSKLTKVSVVGLLSLQASFASAAVSGELQKMDSQWQEVFSAKNLAAVKNYYDESSVVASFPFDAKSSLKGAQAIGNMFQNGPFKLEGFNVSVKPLAFEENDNSALLIKNWNVKHDGGSFSGLAVEVLEKKDTGWKRIIDMSAGGFAEVSQFAAPKADAAAKTSDFAKLSTQSSKVSQISVEKQDTELNANISAALQAGKYQTVESISNAKNGLLVANITVDNKAYVTFNALSQTKEGWEVKAQFFSALK